jgi:predicted acylesterase/phospholipase RssA/CRP-like cAMP-binding protein
MTNLPGNLDHCSLFEGLREEEIHSIVRLARMLTIPSGQAICCQGDMGISMYVLVAGRVRVSARREDGREVVLNYLGQGNHFGELSMLVGGPRTATVTAVVDTELMEISRSDFHSLMASIPRFAANLSRTLGVWLRGEISGQRSRAQTTSVAVVRTLPMAAGLARQLVEALVGAGERVHVVTDRAPWWSETPWIRLHTLPETLDRLSLRDVMSRVLAEAAQASGRIVMDVSCDHAGPFVLMQCELVWWPLVPGTTAEVLGRLTQLMDQEPKLSQRIQRIWLCNLADSLPPHLPDSQAAFPDIRIGWRDDGQQAQRFRPHDMARLVHQLQGLHLGLALGGGGARGIAHVGVLRALESAGIYFDRIAGTSAGALVGAMYAAGFTLEAMLDMVRAELMPPAWMKKLPKSYRWFLLAVYRLGMADRKLRRYLADYCFEQLLIPTHTVSVDLIRGSERVRERGDLVNAILESINIPVIGPPIFRDGDALVDGGVLVNVPAVVLRRRNANFVVAVDVGSKLAHRFGRNTPATPPSRMKRPGLLETIIRVTEVQQRGLAAIHASEADFLIAPDTSPFPFDDFTRAGALVEAGLMAAEKAVPQLKQTLADLTGPFAHGERRVA